MENIYAEKMIISGKVQVVVFRWFTVKVGQNMVLTVYAEKPSNRNVEIQDESSMADFQNFSDKVKKVHFCL
jgi:acylphosphatase